MARTATAKKRKPEAAPGTPLAARLTEYVTALKRARLLRAHHPQSRLAYHVLLSVVRRARADGANRDHAARARTFPASPVSLPQARRRADEFPQPACAPGGAALLVSLAHAAESHPAQPGIGMELPRLGRRLPKHVLTISEVEQVLQQPEYLTVLLDCETARFWKCCTRVASGARK